MEGVELHLSEGFDGMEGYFPGSPLQVIVWISGSSDTVKSDSDGRFEIPFKTATWIAHDEIIVTTEHALRLIARAPDGRLRSSRIRSCPAAPPDVEVTFDALASIEGRILTRPGIPEVGPLPICAVFRDSRPGRYDFFVRTVSGEDGSFALTDLDPGTWRVYPIGLPDSIAIVGPPVHDVKVAGNERVTYDIVLAPADGMSGHVASAANRGVPGARLALLDDTGAEVEHVRLGVTPAILGAPSATVPGVKPGLTADVVLDVAASPTPFRFARAQGGKSYTVLFEKPGELSGERFGPFVAPSAGLELRIASDGPAGSVVVNPTGIDPLRRAAGRAVLFRDSVKIAELFLPAGDGRETPPGQRSFAGLSPGDYSLEVTVREAWNRSNSLRGTASFLVGTNEERVVDVEVGGYGEVVVHRDAEMCDALRRRIRSLAPAFAALPLVEASKPASPIEGHGTAEPDSRVRFGLPPGAWALYLPSEREHHASGPFRVGAVLRVDVVAGETVHVTEPPPRNGRMVVDARDRALETCYLTVSGVTSDRLPIELRRVPRSSRGFELLGLPAGTYELTFIDRARLEPRAVREVVFDGEYRKVESSR